MEQPADLTKKNGSSNESLLRLSVYGCCLFFQSVVGVYFGEELYLVLNCNKETVHPYLPVNRSNGF
jgi:hypothetical protein